MSENATIGFIGLGVMGGPMCRNIALKHGGRLIAFDLNPASFDEALGDTKAERAASIAEVARAADIIFLSLPGGARSRLSASARAGSPPPPGPGRSSSISAPQRSSSPARSRASLPPKAWNSPMHRWRGRGKPQGRGSSA
jgi:hypothetical protein